MDQRVQHSVDTPLRVYLPTHEPCRNEDSAWMSPRSSTHSTSEDSPPRNLRDLSQCGQCPIVTTSSHRWRKVIAMVAGVFQQTLCWGMIMTFGSILTFYTGHLLPNTSKSAISLVGALPAFIVFSLSLFWGRLLDAGHHRRVNTFAGLCLTAGLTGLAFTGDDGDYSDSKYWQVLLASIPIGIGQSAYFLAAPHMAKTWMPHRRGLAMGITNSGSAVGGIVWPLIFTQITADYSFGAGIGTLAGISALLGIFIVYASIPEPSFQRRAIRQPSKLRTWVPTRAFRSTTIIVHIVAMCCMYSGVLTVPFFIEYWAQRNGMGIAEDIVGGKGVTHRSGPRIVYLVVIMNACQIPGRILGSALCDKFKARKIHAISCILAAIVVGPAWLKATTYTHGCVFAAIFGLVLGIMVSLPNNDTADILGPHRVRLFGQYAGVVYTAASPFLLGGVVISGALVDHVHQYAAGVWAIASFAACAVLVTLSLVLVDDTWKLDDHRRSTCSSITLVADEREKHPTASAA